MSVADAARVLGVDRQTLSNLLNARSGISPEMAVRLEKAFGTPARVWLMRQLDYELAEVMRWAKKIKVESFCASITEHGEHMNAVEIEEAISALAEQPFDATEFPFAFLEAFGNKATTIKRLRSGASNKSDLGGVLRTNNIHIATAEAGSVTEKLAALRASSATARGRAKFILATDGVTFEAEDLESGETVACAYADFPNYFGFFLPLAGITAVKQVRDSSFDIRATSRLNKLYVELLKDNPDWETAERRPDMNRFMARLIYCFFAEDTDIFNGTGLFTATIDQMRERLFQHP